VPALRTTPDSTAGRPIPPSLFLGFAVASIGGPLALAAIYVPGAADLRSAGLLLVLGAGLYACPLAVWLRYSEDIVSAGGLAAFVEAAVGRPLALVQAAVWAFSYFLYLPYTVTDIVYEMLAGIFPGIAPWRWLIELTLPLAIVGLVLLGTMPALRVLAVSAALQLVVLLVFGGVLIAHVGVPVSSFTSAHRVARGAPNIALLFLCGSLPLFLGAEAVGGSRTVRRSLLAAGAAVAVYLVFALFAMAAVDPALRHAHLPGYAVMGALAGRNLAIVVGLGAAISVAGLIVAEYLALSRLLYSVTGVPVRRLVAWIGVPFLAADALSLVDPEAFDKHVLRPSLIALYLSQLIVFAVFPVYRRRRGKLTAVDLAIAGIAFALVAWGLYRGITAPVST
jgi:amino acid transporter